MEPNQARFSLSPTVTKWIAGGVIFISLAFSMPSFFYPKVHFGQLGKQTFAAQMIESTANGELDHGVFPFRHFVEVYHPGVVPWAEEVPLYSFMSAGLVKGFGMTPIAAGKFWSMLAFAFILWGFARLAKSIGKPAWIFLAVAATYPVFRLYSVQIMPDLCMTAALIWMVDQVLRGRLYRAAGLLLVASLFKYYAVFTGFGLGLYYLYRKQWKHAFILGLAVLPCVLYVLWFLKLGVPNPIVDSRTVDGHGHLSSFSNVLSPQNWLRVMLWWFVKNASVPGAMLAGVGAYFVFRKPNPYMGLMISLTIGFILFPMIFISSFYVHDYYGLQGSIGICFLSAFGLSKLFEKDARLGLVALALFLGFSIVTVRYMEKLMPDYDVIETAVEKLNIPKESFVLSVSGISKPVISYHLKQNAYIVGLDEWTRPNVQERIQDPRLKFAFVHGFKDFGEMLNPVETDLIRVGFHKLDLKLNLEETTFSVWSK
jgi:hypothetical protein